MAEESRHPGLGNDMPDPILSVVVIGRNEGARLERCLQSVAGMSCPGPFEIIYVDSASSDGSSARAARFGAKVIEIKGGKLSAARARNAGWQSAVAPLILFLDGDTILHPDFAAKAIAELQNPSITVVWGHRREINPQASVYNRVLDLDWIYPPGLAEFCGGDALMRRSALEQAGGFNADLIAGEEPDLCRRIRAPGGLISHIDAPMTGHDYAMTTWRQYWKHSLRAGHAYAEIAARYKGTDDPLWTADSRANAVRACIYLIAPIMAIIAAILAHSWIFILLPMLCFACLILRTALKARGKRASLGTRVLFAIHSHVRQIPIFIGQLVYKRNLKRNWQSGIIEYKGAAGK